MDYKDVEGISQADQKVDSEGIKTTSWTLRGFWNKFLRWRWVLRWGTRRKGLDTWQISSSNPWASSDCESWGQTPCDDPSILDDEGEMWGKRNGSTMMTFSQE